MLLCRSKSVLVVVIIVLIESGGCAKHPGQASKTVSPVDEHVHVTDSFDGQTLNHTIHEDSSGVLRGEPANDDDDDSTAGGGKGDGSGIPSSTPPERSTTRRSTSGEPAVDNDDSTAGVGKGDGSGIPSSIPPERNTTRRSTDESTDTSETTGEMLFPPDSLRTSPVDSTSTRLVDDDLQVVSWDGTRDIAIIPITEEGSGHQDDLSTLPEGSGDGGCPPCDDRELTVLPEHAVPAGTNVSLSCVQPNGSSQLLRWYKTDDGGGARLLLRSFRGAEITLDIPARSGRYLCVRAEEGPCCHRTLDVRVYEVPNYRYHLVVIGVVAAVSLFACLLLAVCRNYKTRKYEVQLENGEADGVYKV